MANKDSLGDRMKGYERVPKTILVKRTPVIIRLDGKAFHTFTRGFNKPYDVVLSNAMIRTMEHLCRNIQGCVFGYTQSDEITLVLVDYKTLNTSAWFDNEVQKMCSVSASMATAYFNKFFKEEVNAFVNKCGIVDKEKEFADRYGEKFIKDGDYNYDEANRLSGKYYNAIEKVAMFDSRVFNIPKEEVCNCLIWRQQDATRNSIEMLGRAYFSDKALFKKNCSNIQDMLMNEYQVNWNDVATRFKRGCACFKKSVGNDERTEWFVDYEMPILTQDRNYVEQHVFVDE